MLLFRDPTFLDERTCRRIRASMDAAPAETAEVLAAGITGIERDVRTRRAAYIDPEAALIAEVERHLDAARAALVRFFRIPLGEREGAGFVRYPPGGFYKPHRDRVAHPSWPDGARRRVAAVLFLNSSRAVAGGGDFDGGALHLFLPDGTVVVHPVAGELVAFPADTLHEVSVVAGGSRDAVVDWFYDPA